VIYLDAAALVKLAHVELESHDLVSWLNARLGMPLVSSALAEVEVPRALRRWDPQALPAVPAVLSLVTRMEMDAGIRAAAAAFAEPTVRSLDAIHLATAQRLGAMLQTFVTYDKRLLAVADAYGLPTASPGA
jgi:predicted nucleic acid-binding protein